MAASLTITEEPAREGVRLELDGIPSTVASMTIERTSPSGTTVAVRGAVRVPVEPETAIVRDWEVPFGVQLTYKVTFFTAAGAVVGVGATGLFTLEYTGCLAWLTDLARPTNTLQVTIESFSPLDFEVPAGVHRVLDRRAPVLVTLPAGTPEAELVFLTNTLGERDAVRACLGSGYPFLLRTWDQGIGNIYLGLTDFKEERIVALGTDPHRRWTCDVVQITRPDPDIFTPLPPATYALVLDHFGTYENLLLEAQTYDRVAYTFPDVGELIPPWLPSDV